MTRVLAAVCVYLVACSGDDWLEDAHVLVDGYNERNEDCRTGLCAHDENTDLFVFDGGISCARRRGRTRRSIAATC